MTPTPTPGTITSRPRDWRRASKTRVQARKRALRMANVTYGQLAQAADVTYGMVYKWVNGERTSAIIAAAFVKLTGKDDAA